jgi:TRAP-type C4-dicarboxylate transport system permease small subunit
MQPNTMHRVCDGATRALRIIAALMLVAIVGINAANVAGRYIFSAPFAWGEEVMLYLMIVAIFVAAPAVTWDGTNIRMDILARAVPQRVRRFLEALADLVSLCVAALLVYASVPIVLQLIEFDQRSHAAEIPMALPQGAIPLGLALSVLALIARELSGKAAQHAASPPQ